MEDNREIWFMIILFGIMPMVAIGAFFLMLWLSK